MKYNDFKKYVRKTTLSLKEFASLVGYTPASISNMRKNDYIPRNLAVLVMSIIELEKNNINIYDVIKNIEITKKSSTREKKFLGEKKYNKKEKL